MDYIKREDALTDAMCVGISCQECPFLIHPINCGCKIENYIKSIPAADVEEVIRCKDCKYFLDPWGCEFLGDGCRVKKNGYCYFAERRG